MCIVFGVPIDGFDYRDQERNGHSSYHDVEDPDQITTIVHLAIL